MERLQDMMKARVNAVAKGTSIERLTDDEDVREWLVFGRFAMLFCLWAAMILPVLMIISVRF